MRKDRTAPATPYLQALQRAAWERTWERLLAVPARRFRVLGRSAAAARWRRFRARHSAAKQET
jgi:hypothetical protein